MEPTSHLWNRCALSTSDVASTQQTKGTSSENLAQPVANCSKSNSNTTTIFIVLSSSAQGRVREFTRVLCVQVGQRRWPPTRRSSCKLNLCV